MRILVTVPEGELREDFFPARLRERLESLGAVAWNPTAEQFDAASLRERLGDVNVAVTGWGTPEFTADVLSAAPTLELIAHTGGSVAGLVSEDVYDRGIDVVSANDVMAEHVAEHVLGAIVARLRHFPELDARMKRGEYGADGLDLGTLHGKTIGLVGLGTIGRYLLEHLSSFDVAVRVYDPYVEEAALADFEFVDRASLDTALSSDVVSVHAARTPETIGMLDADRLALVPDGALFVNTARAELVVEDALLAELRSGRISAVLDVYHEEPLPEDHELRSLDNVFLTPHVGGSQIRPPLTEAVIDDVERFRDDDPLEHAISRSQWQLMTR
jgi:phosphoglycerate dehydrogenase-like enzyme